MFQSMFFTTNIPSDEKRFPQQINPTILKKTTYNKTENSDR